MVIISLSLMLIYANEVADGNEDPPIKELQQLHRELKKLLRRRTREHHKTIGFNDKNKGSASAL